MGEGTLPPPSPEMGLQQTSRVTGNITTTSEPDFPFSINRLQRHSSHHRQVVSSRSDCLGIGMFSTSLTTGAICDTPLQTAIGHRRRVGAVEPLPKADHSTLNRYPRGVMRKSTCAEPAKT
mmetsp:Transcript_7264/g.20767  ORF Transcript_7264/g.20767 Transcript_7264/m.20767 type:complete len:121 (-) Transcript_7264:2066-2428(-)